MTGGTSRTAPPLFANGTPEPAPTAPTHGATQAACGAAGKSLRSGSRDEARFAAIGSSLSRLADLHTELASVYRQLAQEGEIQLAACPHPRLMDGVDGSTESSAATSVPGRLLTVGDLAIRLQVGQKTVRRWRENGKLPAALQMGGVVRWRAQDIDAWIEERRG